MTVTESDADSTQPLLAPDEAPPCSVENSDGRSPFLLICDHAGQAIPRRLQNLGLSSVELDRHIAWDIGAAAVSRKLAAALDAPLILQTYSRLVIDCNRPLQSAGSIVTVSERTPIPGNLHVGAPDRAQRASEIFWPYHDKIRETLDARSARGEPTLLLAMHSYTPVYLDEVRPWHVGVLYNRDARLAHFLLASLRGEADLLVGDNEPYTVSDETDFAIPEYGERRGLPHAEIEIRQDLIADEAGQEQWAQRLARLLRVLDIPSPRERGEGFRVRGV